MPSPGREFAGTDPHALGYSIGANGIAFSQMAITYNGIRSPEKRLPSSYLRLGGSGSSLLTSSGNACSTSSYPMALSTYLYARPSSR